MAGIESEWLLKKNFFRRFALYAFGLFVMAIGVVISVHSGLGISPFNSMCYAIASVLGVELSVILNAALLLCVVLQIMILRKEFQLMNLMQVIWSLLFSWLVSVSEIFLKQVTASTYLGQLMLLFISIFLIGLGIEIYTNLEFVPMSSDSLVLTIAHRCGDIPFYRLKIIYDCTCVLLGIAISLLFLGRLSGFREGTILSALLTGWATKLLRRPAIFIIGYICRDRSLSH